MKIHANSSLIVYSIGAQALCGVWYAVGKKYIRRWVPLNELTLIPSVALKNFTKKFVCFTVK